MVDNDAEGLKGDAQRQAVASLRGYAYQIWQSVYRWITLRKDERLYLEGAEDLDVLGPGGAETVQVKDTQRSGSVTLRSQDILEAIRHFWEVQEQNPNVTIHFRLLTTAVRGQEQHAPFGNTRGLDYWDLCRRPGTDLLPLRDFLKSQVSLPDSLRNFLAVSDDSALRELLITRIDWDTGNNPKAYIEDLVSKEVVYYGQQYHHLPPSESLKVVPHLLKHVWDVVCQENNRRLEYFDFMQLFEHLTTERAPKHELDRLRQLPNMLMEVILQGPLGATERLAGMQGMILHTSLPPLPDRVARRDNLVTVLSQHVQTNGLLVLQGSIGMGKSTLATLIAQADRHEWQWLHMRGHEPEQIREQLQRAALVHKDPAPGTRFVIDDLHFGDQVTKYEQALLGFLHAVLSRGGYVIMTTQGEIPSRIVSHFHLPLDPSIEVPPLGPEEIKHMVREHGCASEEALNAWSLIIWLRTRGHPQLAHAWIRKVAAMHWPLPRPEDMAEARDIETVRREARSALREHLPSDDARTLAYRLSVLGQPFRRDHALLLGTEAPSLNRPGEAFDLLIGPWVGRVNDTYYHVSPLLDEAAKDMWPTDHITDLHSAAAQAFLRCQPCTPLEVSGALRHSLASGAVAPLMVTLDALIHAPGELWPDITQQCLWLAVVGLTPGESLVPAAPFLSVMLRFFQFRIAADFDSRTLAPLVANAWEQEIESITIPDMKFLLRFIFLGQTLVCLPLPLSQSTIVSRVVEVMHLIQERPHRAKVNDATSIHELTANEYLKELITFAIPRCQSPDDLNEFLSAVEALSDETREAILVPWRADDYWVNILCSKVWFQEAHTASPNWGRCIEVFERVIEVGFAWNMPSLIAYAYRALAVIYDEYLENSQTALALLAQGQAQLGQSHPVLEDARAMVLFRRSEYSEALRIWETVLPYGHHLHDTTLAFSYRHAAICAAEEGDWHKAADMALQGESAAQRATLAVMAVGLRADHAFACWKGGDTPKALDAFAQVLESLPALPDPQTDLPYYTLHRRVEYAMAWILQEHRAWGARPEPPPGYLSDSEIDDSSRDYRLQPSVFLWSILANIEYEAKVSDTFFKRLEEESQKISLPKIDFNIALLRIRHHLRKLQLSSLVHDLDQLFLNYYSSLEKGDAIQNEQVSQVDSPQLFDKPAQVFFLVKLLFAALVMVVGQKISMRAPVEQWRSEAIQCGLDDPSLESWFKFVEESGQRSPAELVTVMLNVQQGEMRSLAALLLSASDSVKPVDRFYADVLLVIEAHEHMWRRDIEEAIEGLVTQGWLRTITEQSFALLSPSLHSPSILTACRDTSRGLPKAAKILLAAKNVVRLSISDEILGRLRALAQELGETEGRVAGDQ